LPPPPNQKHSLALSKTIPYRVVYEVVEEKHLVVIAAVIHAARHDREWRSRV